MAKSPYLFASDGTWLSEERQRFESSFDGSRFDTSWPSAHAALCDQNQQAFDLCFIWRQAALAPCQPDLQAVFEAQLARQDDVGAEARCGLTPSKRPAEAGLLACAAIPDYMLRRYSPPTSYSAWLICPREWVFTACISAAKTFLRSRAVFCR